MKFLEQLKEGKVPDDIKVLAAEGAIPLETKELFEVLAILLKDENPEIQEKAKATLESLSENMVVSYLQSRNANPAVLEFYLEKSLQDKNYEIFERVVKNPQISDELLLLAAKKADKKGIEILAENQVRIIASRELIEAIKENPESPEPVKALMNEWLRIYYREGAEAEARIVEEEEKILEEIEEIDEEILEEIEELKEEFIEEIKEVEEIRNIFTLTWDQIKKLTVPEKIKLALMGTKMHRAILIRDPNKIVVEAVLQSPKLTEAEIQTFLRMKGLPAEVVQKIANMREWLRSYSIIVSLVKHPKTPPHVAFNLLPRLMKKDLVDISRSREIPEVVRRAAQNLLQRKEKHGG